MIYASGVILLIVGGFLLVVGFVILRGPPTCINPAFCNNGGEIDFFFKRKKGKDEET